MAESRYQLERLRAMKQLGVTPTTQPYRARYNSAGHRMGVAAGNHPYFPSVMDIPDEDEPDGDIELQEMLAAFDRATKFNGERTKRILAQIQKEGDEYLEYLQAKAEADDRAMVAESGVAMSTAMARAAERNDRSSRGINGIGYGGPQKFGPKVSPQDYSNSADVVGISMSTEARRRAAAERNGIELSRARRKLENDLAEAQARAEDDDEQLSSNVLGKYQTMGRRNETETRRYNRSLKQKDAEISEAVLRQNGISSEIGQNSPGGNKPWNNSPIKPPARPNANQGQGGPVVNVPYGDDDPPINEPNPGPTPNRPTGNTGGATYEEAPPIIDYKRGGVTKARRKLCTTPGCNHKGGCY